MRTDGHFLLVADAVQPIEGDPGYLCAFGCGLSIGSVGLDIEIVLVEVVVIQG